MNDRPTDLPTAPDTQQVSFILLPGFALTSFSLAIETLSVANQLGERELYRCTISSPDAGDHVVSSNGVPIAVNAALSDCRESDLLILCAYRNAPRYRNEALTDLLKSANRGNRRIAALSCGSFVLARAGLLKDRGCTVVPEYRTTFSELYPDIPLQENLFTVAGNISTCAGGTTALDMLLFLIGRDHGRDFIDRVSLQFMQDRIRSSEAMQSTCRQVGLRIKSPGLGAAVELMEKHIADPYPIATLAERIGTTPRNLETVFRKHEQTTPGRYYMRLRLQHARNLLQETALSITAVAQATGFSTQSHFSKCFREQFGVRPSDLRR